MLNLLHCGRRALELPVVQGQPTELFIGTVVALEVYSSELVCGVSSGVIDGATGQMSELVGG